MANKEVNGRAKCSNNTGDNKHHKPPNNWISKPPTSIATAAEIKAAFTTESFFVIYSTLFKKNIVTAWQKNNPKKTCRDVGQAAPHNTLHRCHRPSANRLFMAETH
jgi:hypothetical protein